ncbi:MAG: hypothetical protein PHY47_00270 [Lachnospiraceae bacterium]|nr:hypothetical protein [Lachnospiraceae bacterium]
MSQTIGSIYSNVLKEKHIKSKLRTGKIPAIEEINESINQLQMQNNNFSIPLLKKEDYRIENEEISSASKMNKTFDLLYSDLSVCVKSLLIQGNNITDIYDSTFSKLEGFERRLEGLQSKIATLLFESKNSDRHEEIFYEKFDSKDMVDLANTTVDIDDISNTVTLKPTTSNLIPLENSGTIIQVNTVPNASIVSSLDLIGLEAGNLLNQSNNTWQHQVTTKDPVSQISVDLILTLPSNTSEVNKIIVEPANANIRTQIALEVSYSQDGINWLFPVGESNKRLVKRTSYDFNLIKAAYWRLRLTKQGNDGFFGNNYSYNFGLKSLLFLGKEYQKINLNDIGVIHSKIIKPKKIDKISSVSMKICESKAPSTQIKYELCPLIEQEITDLETGILSLKDLRFYSADAQEEDSFVLDMLKLISEPLIDQIKIDSALNYKDQRSGDYLLDLDLTGMSKSDTVILRSPGDNSLYQTIGKARRQRSNALGWNITDLYCSTYVLIESPDGEIIDIGQTEIIINGKAYSGKVRLSPGLNQVTSLKKYWHSVDLSTLPLDKDIKVDPLYPYNHKYLIEGIGSSLYGRDTSAVIDGVSLINIIDPLQVYRKKHKIWQYRLHELSFEQIESEQKSTLDVFSYKVDNTNQERIVVKSELEGSLLDSESFSIITKIQDSNPVKGLIFKATLSTENLKSTPVLTEYLLKFR